MKCALFCSSFIGLLLTSCATIRVPLCGDLARTLPSGDGSHSHQDVSDYTVEAAKKMGVNLTVLSPFVMTVHGFTPYVNKFQSDYPFLVCGFDPSRVVVPYETYLRCMDHVNDWVRIVGSEKPEDLMLPGTEYEATCASGT